MSDARHRRCLLAAAALGVTLQGCAALYTPTSGLVADGLAACPPAPHCVSSRAADDAHRVDAFMLRDPQRGWLQLLDVVRATARAALVASDERYAHAEVVSPWHFYTDDLELLRGPMGRVDVRSSSRVGYYDFQVNRRRVELLRKKLEDSGIIVTGKHKT